MSRGEALQECQEGEEEVVSELVHLVKELKQQHEGFSTQANPPVVEDCFSVALKQRGPPGYHSSLLVLETQQTDLTLAVFGEDKYKDTQEPLGGSDSSTDDTSGSGAKQFRRRLSLRDSLRKKDSTRSAKYPIGRSRSLNNVRGKVSSENTRGTKKAKNENNNPKAIASAAQQPLPDPRLQRRPSLEDLKSEHRVTNTTNVYEPEDPIGEPRAETIPEPKKPQRRSNGSNEGLSVDVQPTSSPDVLQSLPEGRGELGETGVPRLQRQGRDTRSHRRQRRRRGPVKLKCSLM